MEAPARVGKKKKRGPPVGGEKGGERLILQKKILPSNHLKEGGTSRKGGCGAYRERKKSTLCPEGKDGTVVRLERRPEGKKGGKPRLSGRGARRLPVVEKKKKKRTSSRSKLPGSRRSGEGSLNGGETPIEDRGGEKRNCQGTVKSGWRKKGKKTEGPASRVGNGKGTK